MIASTKKGRHVRRMNAAEAFATAKYSRGKNTITCASCPKWKANFCSIQAKVMLAKSMACNYGKVLIAAIRQAKKWRKRK